jgi:hypothetical protein
MEVAAIGTKIRQFGDPRRLNQITILMPIALPEK